MEKTNLFNVISCLLHKGDTAYLVKKSKNTVRLIWFCFFYRSFSGCRCFDNNISHM